MLGILDKTSHGHASPEELTSTLATLTHEAELSTAGNRLPDRKLRKEVARTAQLLIMTTDSHEALTPDVLNLLESAIDVTGGQRKLVAHVLEVVEALPPDDFHRRVIETTAEKGISTESAMLELMKEGARRAPQELRDETATPEVGVGPEYDFVFDPNVDNPMSVDKQPPARFSLYKDKDDSKAA